MTDVIKQALMVTRQSFQHGKNCLFSVALSFLSLLNYIEEVEPSKSVLGGTAKSQCYRHGIPTLEGAVVYKFGSNFPSSHTHTKKKKIRASFRTLWIEMFQFLLLLSFGIALGFLKRYITLSYLNWLRNGSWSKLEVEKPLILLHKGQFFFHF